MGFSFSATARCDLCGEYLSDSEEECDHGGHKPVENMFRRIGTKEPHIVSVEACPGWHWFALKDMVGDDWIAYEWLGPKSIVKGMVGSAMWESIEDVPKRSMSIDAPDEVDEYGE